MRLPPEPWVQPLRVIVLAAQRAGVVDPLAERFGVSHKCLVPIAGESLIGRVITAVCANPKVESIAVSIEKSALPALGAILAGLPKGPPVECVPSRDNIADSVSDAASGHGGPFIVTTADNVLLDPGSIDAVLSALKCGDAAIAMTTREAVLAAHPDGQHRFYRFRCGEYSNCNLYGLASPQALAAAEAFRGGGQFAKRAWRIVTAFGVVNLILLRLRLVTLAGALRRISRRLGVRVIPVVLADGTQAIDVDNDRTFAVAEALLAKVSRPDITDHLAGPGKGKVLQFPRPPVATNEHHRARTR